MMRAAGKRERMIFYAPLEVILASGTSVYFRVTGLGDRVFPEITERSARTLDRVGVEPTPATNGQIQPSTRRNYGKNIARSKFRSIRHIRRRV